VSRPPRIPNWLPWEKPTIYFITFCIASRKSVLANAKAWEICRAVFDKLEWRILSAIAMPDHLHILVAPVSRDACISDFSKWFKRWFNEAYRASNRYQPVRDGVAMDWRWQEGCFDRLLRSDESLSEKWEYLCQNPVRAGLVEHSEDWPYQFQFNAYEFGV
jgi:REP element-mobilizing transposase RayT